MKDAARYGAWTRATRWNAQGARCVLRARHEASTLGHRLDHVLDLTHDDRGVVRLNVVAARRIADELRIRRQARQVHLVLVLLPADVFPEVFAGTAVEPSRGKDAELLHHGHLVEDRTELSHSSVGDTQDRIVENGD